MAGYLNTAYYGRDAYGIQAAARAYFNKDAKDLNPSECAFLAAVLKGATYYDPAGNAAIDPATPPPRRTRKRAEERWSVDPRRGGQGRAPDARPSGPSTRSSR